MRKARLLLVGLPLVALGALSGCRPARGPEGVPPPGPGPDFAQAYQGQARILPSLGDKGKLSFSRGAALKKGGCDVAVLVTSAALEGGSVRLALESIGLPRVEKRAVAHPCEKPPRDYVVTISGFDPRASLATLSEEVDRVLQTPERFLAGRGVEFAPKQGVSPGPVADKRLKAHPEERMLARNVTRPYERLLTVAPIRRDDRRAVHYQGEVPFEAVVGSDGRLSDARLLAALGAHTERILKALELWRYEPARKGDEAVGFRTEERTVFRVY
jgi:hypothetical protein